MAVSSLALLALVSLAVPARAQVALNCPGVQGAAASEPAPEWKAVTVPEPEAANCVAAATKRPNSIGLSYEFGSYGTFDYTTVSARGSRTFDLSDTSQLTLGLDTHSDAPFIIDPYWQPQGASLTLTYDKRYANGAFFSVAPGILLDQVRPVASVQAGSSVDPLTTGTPSHALQPSLELAAGAGFPVLGRNAMIRGYAGGWRRSSDDVSVQLHAGMLSTVVPVDKDGFKLIASSDVHAEWLRDQSAATTLLAQVTLAAAYQLTPDLRVFGSATRQATWGAAPDMYRLDGHSFDAGLWYEPAAFPVQLSLSRTWKQFEQLPGDPTAGTNDVFQGGYYRFAGTFRF